MLFISMNHRPAIVSPASKAGRPTMTESLLGAPIQRTAKVVGWGGGVRVRECERVCVCVRACVRARCVCNIR